MQPSGDSHKGMCLEFDSAGGPMRNARQVKYDDHYPNVDIPLPPDERAAKPALVKSRNWEYESEYRSFIIPDITEDDSKWIRFIEPAPSSLTGIYFGACAQDKDRVLDLVERGIFNPRIYDSELSESTFSLKCTIYPLPATGRLTRSLIDEQNRPGMRAHSRAVCPPLR